MFRLCGCYYQTSKSRKWVNQLPLLSCEAQASILSTTSRTKLTQKFSNPSSESIKECVYAFPLYDGVSVVGFTYHVGQRTIHGVVKEKNSAKAVYDAAVSRGETAGLLTQLPESADVFSTKLGNVPANETVVVEIVYIGELKYDAETEGIRYAIPTSISPRYGHVQGDREVSTVSKAGAGFKVTVDASMAEGAFIQSIQSPTHPIAVTLGTLSTGPNDDPVMYRASATLSLGSTALDKDFVLLVKAKDADTPKALLETHPTIKRHRALMLTLVPKFSLPSSRPEIVFVVDRSGSMQENIPTLISATKIYLKSLPLGVKFNICSFGSTHSFLWPKSKSYTRESLDEAISHAERFGADMGGTEMFSAVEATVKRRYPDIPCEIMLLTDGEIWGQDELFHYLNEQVALSEGNLRLFSLGIGDGVSSSLIEGIARAGNGFAQTVGIGEKMDAKVVRMLKGALSPHISDYTLEVKYSVAKEKINADDDDFEIVNKVTDGMKALLPEAHSDGELQSQDKQQAPISLYDQTADPNKEDVTMTGTEDEQRYSHLPQIPIPKLLQAPHKIPPLFPFTRTSVYLLMSPDTHQKTPTSVILRATSQHGPLELEIPVETISQSGETLHQLAAKKAVQDLEEGRGWIYDTNDGKSGRSIKAIYPSRFDDIVEREAVRLGVQFQIAGKWTSFVAVSNSSKDSLELPTNVKSTQGRSVVSFDYNSGSDEIMAYCLFDDDTSQTVQPNHNFVQNSSHSNYKNRLLYARSTGNDTTLFGAPTTRSFGDTATASSARKISGSGGLFGTGSGSSNTVFSFGNRPATFGAPVPASASRSGPMRFGASPPAPTAASAFVPSSGSTESAYAAFPPFAQQRAASSTIVSQYDARSPVECTAPASDLLSSSPSTPSEIVHAIIALQNFDGSWTASAEVERLLSLSPNAMVGHLDAVLATVYVVVFLEQKMKSEEGVWELVVEKARGWLATAVTIGQDKRQELEDEALRVLRDCRAGD